VYKLRRYTRDCHGIEFSVGNCLQRHPGLAVVIKSQFRTAQFALVDEVSRARSCGHALACGQTMAAAVWQSVVPILRKQRQPAVCVSVEAGQHRPYVHQCIARRVTTCRECYLGLRARSSGKIVGLRQPKDLCPRETRRQTRLLDVQFHVQLHKPLALHQRQRAVIEKPPSAGGSAMAAGLTLQQLTPTSGTRSRNSGGLATAVRWQPPLGGMGQACLLGHCHEIAQRDVPCVIIP